MVKGGVIRLISIQLLFSLNKKETTEEPKEEINFNTTSVFIKQRDSCVFT